MNPVPLFLIIVSLPLLLGGCGEKPVAEVKPVEEKQQEVKPEEPVAETKPAETVSVSPNLKYETKDDAVTITGCDKKASGALTIPATIEGKPVTSIGNYTFQGCTRLTSINIPDGVTSIGSYAFYVCTSLTSITIGNGVTSIEEGTFAECSSLTSITIPDNVTSIGSSAFSFSESLTSITIGNGVTSIEGSAFLSCTDLSAVTFLGNAPKAGEFVFLHATPTIYRKPEAKGWGKRWGGRPVKLISEKP